MQLYDDWTRMLFCDFDTMDMLPFPLLVRVTDEMAILTLVIVLPF